MPVQLAKQTVGCKDFFTHDKTNRKHLHINKNHKKKI